MKKILLASHGKLSEGMFDTIQMIAGASLMEHVIHYSLKPGENAADYANEYAKVVASSPEDQFIIITDIFGGSVHTSFSQILTNSQTILFSGMNVSLVLELLTKDGHITKEDCELSIESSQGGIQYLTKENFTVSIENDDF